MALDRLSSVWIARLLIATAGSTVATQATHARFELVKRWESPSGTNITHPFPSVRFADGSRYLRDLSRETVFSLWRLNGASLSPLDDFELGDALIVGPRYGVVDGNPILSMTVDGVLAHWRIVANDIVPLADEFGPIPYQVEDAWSSANAGIFAFASDETHGREIWLIDSKGYHLIRDVNPGTGNAIPTSNPTSTWQGSNSTVQIFSLDDGKSGLEPWIFSGGTLNQLADLVPGSEPSLPVFIGRSGETIYFGALPDRVFKYQGSAPQLVLEENLEVYFHDWRASGYFQFEGNFVAWFGPSGWDPGYVLRIAPDGTSTSFRPRSHFFSALYLTSVVPWNGAIEIIGEDLAGGGFDFVKIVGDSILTSLLFTSWAYEPIVHRFTETELLFQEQASYADNSNVYCIKDGVVRPVWKGITDRPSGKVDVINSGDWIYLVAQNSEARTHSPGAVSELWAMPWPAGCGEAWRDELIHESGFEPVAGSE